MSNYAENKKKIETIRNKDEVMFRMAISHLMDVGIRHLDEENIKHCCEEIMKRDDSHSFMTNQYQCDLVKMAGELAQVSHIDLLVYIQREVDYDLFDGTIGYNRVIKLLKRCMGQIEANEDYNNVETLKVFQDIDFDDDEIESLGFGYLLEGEEE